MRCAMMATCVLLISNYSFSVARAEAASATVKAELRRLPAFVLSFWCGPPAAQSTAERYRQVRAAGFNVAMPPCEGGGTVEANLKILAAAHQAGVTAFVADSRMPLHVTGDREAQGRIAAIA